MENIFGNHSLSGNICMDFIRFSSYADELYSGMDLCGNREDIISSIEHPGQGISEIIRYTESLKQTINTEFLKHVSVIRNLFVYEPEILRILGLNKKLSCNLSSWLDQLTFIYLALLSNRSIYEKIKVYGISLEEIETMLANIIQLEGSFAENKI